MSEQLYLVHYWIVILLMMTGLYVVIASGNIIKNVAGLSIFQTSVFLFFIAMGKVDGGTLPIAEEGITLYSNPLPQVIVLTAIVVAVATMALGLSIAVRIFNAYGSLEEDSINKAEQREELNPNDNGAGVCDLPEAENQTQDQFPSQALFQAQSQTQIQPPDSAERKPR